jgi:hypothetical protein
MRHLAGSSRGAYHPSGRAGVSVVLLTQYYRFTTLLFSIATYRCHGQQSMSGATVTVTWEWDLVPLWFTLWSLRRAALRHTPAGPPAQEETQRLGRMACRMPQPCFRCAEGTCPKAHFGTQRSVLKPVIIPTLQMDSDESMQWREDRGARCEHPDQWLSSPARIFCHFFCLFAALPTRAFRDHPTHPTIID